MFIDFTLSYGLKVYSIIKFLQTPFWSLEVWSFWRMRWVRTVRAQDWQVSRAIALCCASLSVARKSDRVNDRYKSWNYA